MKNKSGKILLSLPAALLLTAFVFFTACLHHEAPALVPAAKAGFLDLTDWDFERYGHVDLKGEWQVYWNQLVLPGQQDTGSRSFCTLPVIWNDQEVAGGQGTATFRLRIRLASDIDSLAFKFLDAGTAWAVYVNDQFVSGSGQVGKDQTTSHPGYKPHTAQFRLNGAQELDLVLQVSNFHHRLGGPWEIIRMGHVADIEQMRNRAVSVDLFLLGSIFIMGIYHLFLYLLRRSDKAPLYFGICCLLIAIRLITTGERYLNTLMPNLDWIWLIRSEYLSYYLTLPFFALFVYSVFDDLCSRKVINSIVAIAAVASILVLILPATQFSWTLPFYQAVTVAACFYGVFVMTLAIFHKKEGAVIFMVGFLVLFLAIINDILYVKKLIWTMHLTPSGLFVFILSQAFLLSIRFSRSFATVEAQSLALARSNHVISKEIDERRCAEKKLRKSQGRLSMALDASDAGVWELFPATGEITIDRQFLEKLGYSPGELSASIEALFAISSPEDIEKIRAAIDELNRGESDRYEMVHQVFTKSGDPRWVHTKGRVIERDEKEPLPLLISGTTLDITDRRQAEVYQQELEAKLRQAQKMESIGTLAGGIAHDFNNILGAIIGYGQIAQQDVAGHPEIRESIDQILSAGERAKALIQQILTYSRRKQFSIIPSDFGIILQESLSLVRASFPASIEVRFNNRMEKSIVMADATQMHQVLMNLFTNALHAMEDSGGTLSVDLRSCDVINDIPGWSETIEAGRYLKLTIRDTGCGMDGYTLGRLYDPYFTTKAYGKGTGMGMASVHGIVKGHHGAITVESEPGSGTVFTLYLPLTEEMAEAGIPEIEKVQRGSMEQILLVDDEETLVTMGKQILEQIGYRVDVRTDPRSALSTFREAPEKYELIITDLTMPHMSGEDLTREVKRIRPDIPVVMCTGYNKSMTRDKAQRMGAMAFVQKPYSISKMAEVVYKVLHSPPAEPKSAS